MLKFLEQGVATFRRLPASRRFLILLGIGLLFILIVPSGTQIFGPAILLLFWAAVSADNRTIGLSTLLIFFAAGLIAFVPTAMLLETPGVLIFGKETMTTALINQSLEALLMAASLAALSLWPGSRLRYTGGIMDFALVGLSLGAGLECGLGVLYPQIAGFTGRSLGMLPQLPGMLGNPHVSVACSSPSIWGMGMGLILGIGRYLVGPDFDTAGYKWGYIAGALAIFLLWMGAERVGYIRGAISGQESILFWIDLKGRLLAYAMGLFSLGIILVEWLLMQEHAPAIGLNPLRPEIDKVWNTGEKFSYTSVFNRTLAVIRLVEHRGLLRELILAEEMKHLLSPADQARLDQRTLQVKHLLAAEGGE